MNTGYVTHAQSQSTFLRRVLIANSLFSGLSGLVLVAMSEPVSAFLGLPWPWTLIAIGVGLLIYAAQLLWAARQSSLPRQTALGFVVMDAAWVLGSAVLLAAGWVPFTPAGRWAVIIVADIVALFALLQLYGLRRMQGTKGKVVK